MSTVEEDVELRDLVAQTLEKNGCLSKLRAELRASIFLALDEDIKLSKQQPLQNLRIQSYLETPEGRAMFCLVREFLDFFNLQFTISVYEPESYFESIGQYEGRQKIAQDLGLDNMEEPTVPLLQQLLKIAQAKSKILDINLNINNNVNGSFIDESLNIDSSYKKTETFNTLSKTDSNNDTKLESDPNIVSEPVKIENISYLNNTFDLNSPTVNLSQLKISQNISSKNILKDEIKEEDSQDKISVVDSSKASVNFDASLKCVSELVHDKNDTLSSTFEVNSPKINTSHSKVADVDNKQHSESNKKVLKEDDTYEDTSSIAEDSEVLANTNGLKVAEKPENEVPLDSSANNKLNEVLVPPSSSASKPDLDKPKLFSQRPKSSLSSLTDLPPLTNKTRVNSDILPSLYSKEFKNKSNLKELDKMFDMDADYEEDFMYSSNELSLNTPSLNSAHSKVNSLEEQGVVNKMDSEKLNTLSKKDPKNTSRPEMGKSMFRQKTCSSSVKTGDHSNNGSISEHSLSD